MSLFDADVFKAYFSADKLAARIYAFGELSWVIESLSTNNLALANNQHLENENNLLLEQTAFWSLKGIFDRQAIKGIKETVLGQRNLTVIFDPLLIDGEAVKTAIATTWSQCQQTPINRNQPKLTLPIYFGGEEGPDLDTLAETLGISCESFVQQYCQNIYTVLFLGFQPGFAYLHGLPKALKAPRLTNPRSKIPTGSLAIGGEQTGIYPSSSPGGWQIIGRISDAFMPLFDPSRQPPSRLQIGDTLRFVPQTHTNNGY